MSGKKGFISMLYLTGFILVLGLFLVPLPAIVLKILFGIELAAIIFLLVYSLTGYSEMMPTADFCCTLFTLAINISFTRFTLSGLIKGEQVPLVFLISDFVIPGKFVMGIILIAFLMVSLAVVEIKTVRKIPEVSARIILDFKSVKTFEIDNRLSKNEITQKEAKLLKEVLKVKSDFVSLLEGAAKFLSGNVKMTYFLIAVNICGGCLIERLIQGKDWLSAIESAVICTTGNVAIFVVPQIIVSVVMWNCVMRSDEN